MVTITKKGNFKMIETKIEIQSVSFQELEIMNKNSKEGFLVVRGAGHPDHSQSWIDGINKDLLENNIIASPINEAFTIQVNKDRNDLILVWTTAEGINIGALSIWRLGNLEWCCSTWLEDYLVNDKKDFR